MHQSSHPFNAANSGSTNEFLWVFSGSLSTEQNNLIPKYSRSKAGIIDQLKVLMQEAPTGQAAIFTFKKNGSSIGTVTVAAGAVVGTNDLATVVAFDAGDIFTVEITQRGSINFGTTATIIARTK